VHLTGKSDRLDVGQSPRGRYPQVIDDATDREQPGIGGLFGPTRLRPVRRMFGSGTTMNSLVTVYDDPFHRCRADV
jgi:hypothetical protein